MPGRKSVPPLRGYHSAESARRLIGRIGQFTVGHFAKKPGWGCTSETHVLHTVHHWSGIRPLRSDADWLGAFRQYVRCRKCDGCRSFKRAMWSARAIYEAEATASRGRRTWVLTATHRVRLTERADEEFSAEITKALKRLRKLTAFRYLLVFERHKVRPGSVETVGYPHCHALIHEVGKILWEDIEICFSPVGFFKAKLLEGDPAIAAGYVGKYMTKGDEPMVCRVRASIGYGEVVPCDNPPIVPTHESLLSGVRPHPPVATTPPEENLSSPGVNHAEL